MAKFNDLPTELQQEIYRLSCLPEPGSYCLTFNDIPSNSSRWVQWFKNEEPNWMVQKREYPTAMHICHSSREYVLAIQEQEDNRAARLGIPPINYHIGRMCRPFKPELDIVFVYSWELLHTLDRAVGDSFSFSGPYRKVKHIAMDLDCLRYHDQWLQAYYPLQRFPNLRDFSIVFRDDRGFPFPRLAHVKKDLNVAKGSREDLICKYVEAQLRKPQPLAFHLDPVHSSWSPLAQLVGMVVGIRHEVKVSAAQLVMNQTQDRAKSSEEWEIVQGTLGYTIDCDRIWMEGLEKKFGRKQKRCPFHWNSLANSSVRWVQTNKYSVTLVLYYIVIVFFLVS